jgi:Ferredoxin-like domain in Api92-like protein
MDVSREAKLLAYWDSLLRAFLEAVKWEDEIFDFHRLIPMPEILKHTGTGSRTIDGQDVTSWYVVNPANPIPGEENVRVFTPEELAVLEDIGHDSWYSWCIQHWGIKWNACRSHIESLGLEAGAIEIAFETAWAAPLPIFYKMREMFPHLTFTCQWRDEDDGYQHLHTLNFEAAA